MQIVLDKAQGRLLIKPIIYDPLLGHFYSITQPLTT